VTVEWPDIRETQLARLRSFPPLRHNTRTNSSIVNALVPSYRKLKHSALVSHGLPQAQITKMNRYNLALSSFLLLAGLSSTSSSSSSEPAISGRTLFDEIVSHSQRATNLLEQSEHRPVHRSLQNASSTTPCVSEGTAAQSCLEGSVAESDRSACVSCFQDAQQTALSDLSSQVSSGADISCDSIDTVVCQPIETCTCVDACVSELEALFDCQLGASFAVSNITAFDSCSISCTAPSGGGGGGSSTGGGNGTSSGGGGGGDSSSKGGAYGGTSGAVQLARSLTTPMALAIAAAATVGYTL
jgi:hypothetical protein